LEGRRKIFHKAPPGSQVENSEGTSDPEISTRGFLSPAEVIHQEQVRSKVLGQNYRVALTRVKMRQGRIG